MEINKLYPFVLTLLMVSMLVAIGLLVFNGFAVGSAETTVISGEVQAWTENNTNVSLDNENLISLTQIRLDNASGSILPTTDYSVDLVNGLVLVLDNETIANTGDDCLFYYTYTEYDTPTEDVMTNASGALDDITGDWLGIIIIVGCLAVILFLVMRSIGRARV